MSYVNVKRISKTTIELVFWGSKVWVVLCAMSVAADATLIIISASARIHQRGGQHAGPHGQTDKRTNGWNTRGKCWFHNKKRWLGVSMQKIDIFLVGWIYIKVKKKKNQKIILIPVIGNSKSMMLITIQKFSADCFFFQTFLGYKTVVLTGNSHSFFF